LPGLAVNVKSDAKGFTSAKDGPFVDVEYKGVTLMVLTLTRRGE
jgi:hypothetical protein